MYWLQVGLLILATGESLLSAVVIFMGDAYHKILSHFTIFLFITVDVMAGLCLREM
jgi:hypothetical protein